MNITFLRSAGWAPWLPLLAVIALPFGRSVELFVLIMAIIGIYDLSKNHNFIRQSTGLKLFSTFFLCFFIPALLSLPDAVNIHHSASTVAGMLRFYFAGIFILSRLTDNKSHLWLGVGISFVLLFWSIDAWLQLLSGFDLLGKPAFSANRISGIFGDDARLGLMIIPFLGISIAAIKEKWNPTLTIIFTLLTISVILISGDRASWVSLFTGILILISLFRPKKLHLSHKQLFLSFTGIVIALFIVINTPQFQSRLNSSLIGLKGGYESINQASSFRLPIWGTALRMFADHPINGVGVRGFRYAYPDYALPGDMFVDSSLPREQQTGAFQPHQIVLEFMSVTGIIGLIGYITALWILFIKWRPLARNQSSFLPTGYLISLMAILFPINSHLAFFSSSSGQIIWFLVALTISVLMIKDSNDLAVESDD